MFTSGSKADPPPNSTVRFGGNIEYRYDNRELRAGHAEVSKWPENLPFRDFLQDVGHALYRSAHRPDEAHGLHLHMLFRR